MRLMRLFDVRLEPGQTSLPSDLCTVIATDALDALRVMAGQPVLSICARVGLVPARGQSRITAWTARTEGDAVHTPACPGPEPAAVSGPDR